MAKIQELRERLNYGTLIMQKLFDVFLSPTPEIRMENIRLTYMAVPSSWRDDEFNEEIEECNVALGDAWELVAENHNPDQETVEEPNMEEYWDDVLSSLINLFDRRNLLIPTKHREFI